MKTTDELRSELCIRFLTDRSDAYEKLKLATVLLANDEEALKAIDELVAQLQANYGGIGVYELQRLAYARLDEKAYFKLPVLVNPLEHRVRLLRDLRRDLCEFAAKLDLIVRSRLLARV